MNRYQATENALTPPTPLSCEHGEGRARLSRGRAGRAPLVVAVLLLLVSVGCSPEGERVRGGGSGADIGNRVPPTELHGDQRRNNPDFAVPGKVNAPRESWGVPGWWASGAR
jgi:hypothetical protein